MKARESERKTRTFSPVFAAVVVLGAALALAGCDNLFNGDKDKKDDKKNELPLTADIGFNTTGSNTTDINLMAAAATGIETANQRYYFSVTEQSAARFTVTKTQAQTLTLGGTDAAKVTRTESGTTVDGSTAGPTLEIFTLDFDDITRYFGGERDFTLTVSEEGKASKTVSITLAAEPDLSVPGCTIFTVTYPEGVETLTRVDAKIDETAVETLKEAIKWIDVQTASGTGDTAWKEYLVRLEKDEPIPSMGISCKDADYVKIRLRGAGTERRITHNGDTTRYHAIGTSGSNMGNGLLNVGYKYGSSTPPKHVALQIENNLTLDGKHTGFINKGDGIDISGMVDVWKCCQFIMEEGSRITRYKAFHSGTTATPVVLQESGAFFMRGGEISDTQFYNDTGAIVYINVAVVSEKTKTKPVFFGKTGGVFRNNTFGGTTQNYIIWKSRKKTVLENDSATQIVFNSITEFEELMD
jgi:hypothetical protein